MSVLRRALAATAIAVAIAASPAVPIPASGLASDVPVLAPNPRLLFGADDVAAYRRRFAQPGVPGQAWTRLNELAENFLAKAQPDLVRNAPTVDPFGILAIAGLDRLYNLQNEMPTYLTTLGFAYQMSGDTTATRDLRFGRRVIELLSALGDAGFPYWSGQDLGIGDLDEGMGLAFDWTYELMTPAERTKIVGDVVRHEALLIDRPLFHPANAYADNLNVSNWMGVTTGGVGLLLLALKDVPGVPASWYAQDPTTPMTYWEKTLERLGDFFNHAFDLTGAFEEGLQYSGYGMKNSIPFAKALQRNGYGDFFAGTGLSKVSQWVALEQLPGEGAMFVPLNDSNRNTAGVDIPGLLFGINGNDGVAQYVFRKWVGPEGLDYYREPHMPGELRDDKCTNRLEPASDLACDIFNVHGNVWVALWYRTPTETPETNVDDVIGRSTYHPRRGLVDARSGFSRGDRGVHETVSTFEARRNGFGHAQFDLGAFTLYGEGGRFGIDPGVSCYACKKPRSQMNAAERANDDDGAYATFHNVVVIDDDTYTQSENSRFNIVDYRGNPLRDGVTIDSFVNAPNLSLSHADLRYAYDFASPYAGRDHLFSRVPGRPVIVAVTDHIQRDSATHSYRWQMLSGNTNLITTDGSAFRIAAPNGATVTGRTAAGGSAGADPVVQVDYSKLQRNVTDDFGKITPTVYTSTARQLAFDHLAIMALTPPGAPPVTTQTLRVANANAIAVSYQGVTDVVLRRLHGSPPVTGDVVTDADIAKFALDGGETVMRGGRSLAAYGLDYASVEGPGAGATVTVSGNEVSGTTNSALDTYRVFAPQPIARATVSGAAVSFCRDGAYVSFPCSTTSLRYDGPLHGSGSTIDAAAVLTDASGAPVAGRPVSFTAMGRTASAVTDGAGRARATLDAQDHGRSQVVTVTFDGDRVYRSSTTTATISWGNGPTLTTLGRLTRRG